MKSTWFEAWTRKLIRVSNSSLRGSRRALDSGRSTELLESRCLLTLAVPQLSSLPGANHTILLDFDGQTVENTSWNSYYNQTTLEAPAYNIDADATSFSATELARITEAFQRVAEDFAPFNVNVTTVDPGVEALRNTGSGDTQWGVRVIITNEANMVTDPAERSGAGGIAYINSFNWNSDTPVWVFTTGGKSIAEAASHEAGHSLGLAHDGTSTAGYYQGHGSGETGWAPIMGVGYYQNVTQWDRGEYYDTNNGSASANYNRGADDLSIITSVNGFGYRTDDHGNSNGSASALSVSGTAVSGSGLITTTNDVDVFSFTTGAGQVSLNVSPFNPGPNLDIKADLYNFSGTLVATSNSTATLSAGFNLNLAAGQYFLHVDGTGWGTPGSSTPSGYTEYGSIGQYTIGGTIVPGVTLPSVSVGDASTTEGGTLSFTVSLSEASASQVDVTYATASGTATEGVDFLAAAGTVTFLPGEVSRVVNVLTNQDTDVESNETLTLNLSSASNATIGDGQGVGTILNDDVSAMPEISISDASVVEGKLNTKGRNAGQPQETNLNFTVTLSAASTETVTVNYQTADGTATVAGSDYAAASGTVTFAAGQTTQTITVIVLGDANVEPDETFAVNLSGASNATIADDSATGTILNDDSTGGGGGGGKGGGPKKIAGAESPQLWIDPMWWFEGPDGFEHDHDHDHDHHDDGNHDAPVTLVARSLDASVTANGAASTPFEEWQVAAARDAALLAALDLNDGSESDDLASDSVGTPVADDAEVSATDESFAELTELLTAIDAV